MATSSELQNRVDHLESILRDRDRKEADARAAALAAQNATDDAKTIAAKAEAAIAEREAIRRGAWTSHLIATAAPAAPVDFTSLGERIPADKSAWPPNSPESSFAFGPGIVPKEAQFDVTQTTLGKMLTSLTPIKP